MYEGNFCMRVLALSQISISCLQLNVLPSNKYKSNCTNDVVDDDDDGVTTCHYHHWFLEKSEVIKHRKVLKDRHKQWEMVACVMICLCWYRLLCWCWFVLRTVQCWLSAECRHCSPWSYTASTGQQHQLDQSSARVLMWSDQWSVHHWHGDLLVVISETDCSQPKIANIIITVIDVIVNNITNS